MLLTSCFFFYFSSASVLIIGRKKTTSITPSLMVIFKALSLTTYLAWYPRNQKLPIFKFCCQNNGNGATGTSRWSCS